MVDYVSAVKKPFEDLQTLVIGIVIGLIPIVQLLNIGYGVLTAKNVMAGNKKLLKWDFNRIVEMIIAVIIVIVIEIVYLIPAMILIAIGIAGALGAFLTGIASNPTNAVGVLSTSIMASGLFLAVGTILGIIAAILLPMAIMNYAKSNNIMSAFDLKTVIKKTLTAKYIISLIVMIIYAIVLMIIAGLISLIPAVGIWIASGIMSFLGTTTAYSIFAEAFAE